MNEPGPEACGQRKGLSSLAWVGIGCGGLALVVIVILALSGAALFNWVKDRSPQEIAARAVIQTNPDLELIEHDSETGKMRVRVISSGEEVTVSYGDLQSGRFAVESGEGSYTVDAGSDGAGTVTIEGPDGSQQFQIGGDPSSLPSWMVTPPGAPERRLLSHSRAGSLVSGSMDGSIDSPIQKVADDYERALNAAGYTVERPLEGAPASTGTVMLDASMTDSDRKVQVMLTPQPDGGTHWAASYNGTDE